MNSINTSDIEISSVADYVSCITNSLKQLANIEIVDFTLSKREQLQQVIDSKYILLAHNASNKPVFNFANQSALTLFEMSWDEFTKLPSKYSAEADEREIREKFLKEVEKNGYSDNYSGIRISKTGRRFKIKGVLLWNVYNQYGDRIGQAAKFDEYEYI